MDVGKVGTGEKRSVSVCSNLKIDDNVYSTSSLPGAMLLQDKLDCLRGMNTVLRFLCADLLPSLITPSRPAKKKKVRKGKVIRESRKARPPAINSEAVREALYLIDTLRCYILKFHEFPAVVAEAGGPHEPGSKAASDSGYGCLEKAIIKLADEAADVLSDTEVR